jgi:phage pi2 protein 07
MEGLPEAEPEYTLIFIPENSFSKFLQTHRNVLIMDIKPENKRSKVETLRNVWSHPQRVVKVKASSDTAFISLFAKHCEAIKELFNQNERARFTAQNALSRNTAVEKMLVEDFGVQMVISKDFYQAKKMTDFVWLRAETNANSLGLMIYTYPYIDTSEVTPKALLDTRDKYTKLYIPGPVAGSYMTIEREFYESVSRKIIFKGMYAIETRGLWKTKGDFMGGPFVNYTVIDAPRQRIVVFDGYVYYPNKSKRNYIRQLEAIIWGAEFVDPGKREKK